MVSDKRKIVDAFAEWDDPHAFRVYLLRDGDDIDAALPMEAVHEVLGADALLARLYKAAFVANAKDFAGRDAIDRVLGWPTKAPAERCVKAVKRELRRLEEGKPGPSNEAIQIALMLLPKKYRGGR